MPVASLLSLPTELLLPIFQHVFADAQPLHESSIVPGCLSLTKNLRQVAIAAAAASVSIEVTDDGPARGSLGRWLKRHQAWQYVQHLNLALHISGSAWVPTITASLLPATPSSVRLQLFLEAYNSEHYHPIPWRKILPFPNDAVIDVALTASDDLGLDVTELLDAFPRLRSLSLVYPTYARYSTGGPSYPALKRFCEFSDWASGLRDIVVRCPNLTSATLQASPDLPPPLLSTGLQELAIAVDTSTRESDHLQFEGLDRYPSLRKLAFNWLEFDGDSEEQCRTALARIPSTVLHLAFIKTMLPSFLAILATFVQDARWLPDLDSIFVTMSTEHPAPEDQAKLEEAASARGIRHRILDRPMVGNDLPSWRTSPWLC
jgi:hypothetical protein